ncbi:hypothetical protein [Paraburkholderia sp. BL25I1N1]|uniref:hypothetical protein n=1 Tax=Paraburkholderia sp. BL25I1N1 TaxID=1938804 RepID=UPI000D45F166|nr:hypothetical protein [Paraburkholderia sp. BL25I1N1]PRY04425.1 TolB-like protein [Paraburkholderia sp. BL25I1N1]
MTQSVVESTTEIGQELDRITTSRLFVNSARLIRFLRFTVDAVLSGRAHLLKEHVIGTQVYDRPHAYDPRVDSVVRVEARRLRSKLQKYYETAERSSALKIVYPIGSYAPVFVVDEKAGGKFERLTSSEPTGPADLYREGEGTSLAILPFKCLTGTEADVMFSAALTDELIYSLSMSPGFRVAARSAICEKPEERSVATRFSGELGVHLFMQGTVRRDGGRYRVIVEMYDSTGFVVWSDRFDVATHTDPCSMERIASAIAARCRFDYSPVRSMSVSPSLAAIRAFGVAARARRAIDEQGPSAVADALRLLTATVAKHPDDTRLLSATADSHVELFLRGMITHEAAYEAAKPAVNRVLLLDEISSEGNCAAAGVQGWLRWNWPKAAAHIRVALEPGDLVRADYLYGTLLSYVGRFDEALSRLHHATGLDSFAQPIKISVARTLFFARRYDSLMETFSEKDDYTNNIDVVRYLGLAYIVTGAREKATRLIERTAQSALLSTPRRVIAAELEAWSGRPYVAARLLEDKTITPGESALLAVALGDHAAAIASLDTARRRRDPLVLSLQFDSRFDALRGYERFGALVKQSRVVLHE